VQARISKRVVDATTATGRDRFIWDTELKGFGLKITPAGRKIYLVQTRLNGSLRRFTIGKHGSPWTPDSARGEALQMLSLIRLGKDPVQARHTGENNLTVGALCKYYLAEGCESKKASTILLDRSRINRHILPLLGSKCVVDLTRADLERFGGTCTAAP
jgi:hypothetical protein